MTNPDNVGGLPDGMVMVQRSDAMRLAMFVEPLLTGGAVQLSAMRIAELCRAAPAGGDSPVAEIGELNGTKLIVCRDEDALARLPKGTKLYTRPQDSAPAGSGEVDGLDVENLCALREVVAGTEHWAKVVSLDRAIALLRKLQQGAE